jgi:hypothetical protein
MNQEIFLQNKYTKWYYAIVNNAISREHIEPNEQHHIIPESFYLNRKRRGSSGWLEGNPNDSSNLVKLTPHEHLVCHLLLPRMTIGPAKHKMLKAALGMSTLIGPNQERKKLTGRMYAKLVEELHNSEIPESAKINYKKAGIDRAKKRKDAGLCGTFKDKKHTPESLDLMKLAASRSKSDAWKESASKNRKGRTPFNKGKTFEELYGEEKATELKKKVANVGEKNGFFGKQHSEEQRKKKSAEKLSAPKVKCYYCNKEVDHMNFSRWHGENCKHKDNK